MNNTTGLEIAIIGISGRYASSKNINEFWQNLISGVELISVFPTANNDDKTIKAGSILEDVDLFDADFFGINPREAEITDPQHRMFLECAWEALENAGYNTEIEERAIGVYAGVGMGTYSIHNLYTNPEIMSSISTLQMLIGTDKDYVPTRVSYKLNLKGPSVSVGTSCSSSLVAVHLACQSLLSGECDMALAAGVAVKVPQNELTLSPSEIISQDGHCRAFDAKANGTLGGNGIGVVVLKRLEEAIADRDTIYAVVKGSAMNNDGDDKIGYTAPSEAGQKNVIQAAQIMAEVEPETIAYIEAHGTGTPLGDPIEIAALKRTFQSQSSKKGYCAIGSVKANVGHLDAAAGITGFIKTVMALKHKVLPPSINFETPNPQIDFDNSPFFVNTKLLEWETNGTPRRAGVNSFGIGGTNAHVILEEVPALEINPHSRSHQLLLLSARTPDALETATENLVNHLKDNTTIPLPDVAYTLQVGRKAFAHRRIVVTTDRQDAVTVLETKEPQRVFSNCNESSNPSTVFMFTGQGSQYVNMAREIYETEQVFREECNRCQELLKPHLDIDIYSLSDLEPTAIAQPVLFISEYALAKLWISWGVAPAAAIGHSIGEYVAATLAGVFSLEDALMLVANRGRLIQQQLQGAMLSTSLSSSQVESLLAESGISGVELAANNAPSLTVVSGNLAGIAEFEHLLTKREINCRRLHTSHAFHSQMMDAMIEKFTEVVKKVNLNAPQIPFISNVTGSWITDNEAMDPIYWGRHLRQPVRFYEGIGELLQDPERIFLEVGPGCTLATFVRKQAGDRVVLSSLRHPQDEQSDTAFLLNTLGQLWLAGVKVDWLGFSATEERCRVPLPTYPFERQRYWVEEGDRRHSLLKGEEGRSQGYLLKKPDIADWFYVPSWKQEILLSADFSHRQRWLVFVDGSEFCSAFSERLSSQYDAEVIQVKIGDKFHRIDNDTYAIDPANSQDYKTLLAEIHSLGEVQVIAHFWSLHPATYWEEDQKFCFYSLLYLVQAFNDKTQINSLQIGVISSNIQNVTGTEKICPEKATVLGACKVITKEFFKINCCHIDVGISEWQERNFNKLIDKIIIELTADSLAPVVAYRSGRRWVETFEPISLEKVSGNKRLRKKGVYLITGGMGGIGFVLAEYLAQTVKAKLVLTGRSVIPPREEWEEFLVQHDHSHSISKKIQKVQQLEQLGAEVLVISADVTDRKQMEEAISRTKKQFGSINGVIHAAGDYRWETILQKTPDEVAKTFAPKIGGTLNLDRIFKDTPLDFFVLLSSTTSITGGVGQIDHAAANNFLDKFASQNRNQFTVAINWYAWQEVGIATQIHIPEQYQQIHDKNIKEAISNKEGVEAFRRILNGDKLDLNSLSQIVVSTIDFQEVTKKYGIVKSKSQKTSEQKSLSNSIHQRPNLANTYVAPSNEMEEKIVSIFEKLIGIEKVGVYDNFFELGGDSLLATQLNSRIREIFQVEISIEEFFEAPKVGGICQKIQDYQSKGDWVKTQTIIPVERQAYRIKRTE